MSRQQRVHYFIYTSTTIGEKVGVCQLGSLPWMSKDMHGRQTPAGMSLTTFNSSLFSLFSFPVYLTLSPFSGSSVLDVFSSSRYL